MRYEKDQYTKGFSICGLIIAGAFFWWGISAFIPYSFGSWWGLIPIGIGLAILLSQIRALVNRKKLRNAVKSEIELNPNASIEDISKSTGISKKDVQAIILDMKMSGDIRGVFSAETGQLKPISQQTSEVKYCQACGTQIKNPTAQFCEYCGANLK